MKSDRTVCWECGKVIQKGLKIDEHHYCGDCTRESLSSVPKYWEKEEPLSQIFTHSELMKKEFAPPEWIIEGILGKGHLGVLTGFSGHGKSWVSLALAVDAASGNKFLNKYSIEKISVLYIENENGVYELRRRSEYLSDGVKLDNLHFAPYPSLDLLESTEWLESQIEEKEIGLVVLDSFAGLHTGKENEAEQMRKILTKLKKIAMDYNVTFVLLIHPNKGANFKKSKNSFPPDYLERIRGSSEFRNVADDIIGIWMPDADEKAFFFEPVKCRTGALQEGEVFQMHFDDEAKTLDFEFLEKKKDYKFGADKCLTDIVIWATNELKEDGKFKTKDAKEAMETKWGKTIVNNALGLVRDGKCDQISYVSRGTYQLTGFVHEDHEVRMDKMDNSSSEVPSKKQGVVAVAKPVGNNTPALGSSEFVRVVHKYIVADNFADNQTFDAASIAIDLKLSEKDVTEALKVLKKSGEVQEVGSEMWRRRGNG